MIITKVLLITKQIQGDLGQSALNVCDDTGGAQEEA
jgi:hypothetical protein